MQSHNIQRMCLGSHLSPFPSAFGLHHVGAWKGSVCHGVQGALGIVVL